jgi:hypothetical protein
LCFAFSFFILALTLGAHCVCLWPGVSARGFSVPEEGSAGGVLRERKQEIGASLVACDLVGMGP